MPTTPSDAITLLAALFGSITAGLLLVRPLRPGREARIGPVPAAPRSSDTGVAAPAERALEATPSWPAAPGSGIWSSSPARRPW